MTAGIIYRAYGHSYTIDGEPADGVTTLIGDGMPKPALISWAANTTAGYAIDNWDDLGKLTMSARLKELTRARFNDMDQAGRRGTEIHTLAEKLIHGEEVDVPGAIAGHVESCVRFLNEWNPNPLLTETVIGNRQWHYAGRLDTISDVPALGCVLLDYKTSRSGVFGEAALQASAYANAEVYIDADHNEQSMADLDLNMETAYAVWIRGDGYNLYPLDIGPDTFKLFLYVATVARRTRTLRELVGEAVHVREGIMA